jgi:hypothetical protein
MHHFDAEARLPHFFEKVKYMPIRRHTIYENNELTIRVITVLG